MVEYLPGQQDLPGCGRTPLWAWLERRAAESLKPAKPQKPCDQGLFGDAAAQTDLVDLLNR